MQKIEHTESIDGSPDGQEQPIISFIHELAQPLTVINNLAQAGLRISRSGAEDQPEVAILFEKIHEEARRASDICRKLPR